MNNSLLLLPFYSLKFFLIFSHEVIIIPIIIIGFMVGKREEFGSAVYLILFTMIFNAALKSTFQIPLAPHLEKIGFAFPSGHMQSAVVFYGWFAYKASSLSLKGFLMLLLAGCGVALVYFGYHTGRDIFGSIGFGVFTLVVYVQFLRMLNSFNPWHVGVSFLGVSTLLLGYLGYQRGLLPHVWMAYFALMGFSVTWGILKPSGHVSYRKGLFGILGCLIFIFLIQKMFQEFLSSPVPSYLFEMQWFLSAGSLPCMVKILSLLDRHGK